MIIKLPADDKEKIAQLERKLKEYQKRIKDPDYYGRSGIKAKVLSELLNKKKVDSDRYYKKIKNEINEFDESDFYDVCAVINDYCETGGQNVHGGTGLH